MDCNNLILFNFNAYRATSVDRLMELRIMFEKFDPDIISIQEIHIRNSLICFSDQYHVIVNIDKSSKDGIGIITLVKKKVILKDVIISDNGRTQAASRNQNKRVVSVTELQW